MKSRRGFVLGTLSAAVLNAAAEKHVRRLRLSNDGQASFDFIRWNPFLTPPPDFSGLPPNADVRVRNIFPFRERDIVETFVYVRLPNNTSAPVSLIYTEIDDLHVSEPRRSEKGSIALFGKVIANPVPSPFGSIIGLGAMFGGTYDRPGQNTRFEFFGGLIAGSHATIVPLAYGSLQIGRG